MSTLHFAAEPQLLLFDILTLPYRYWYEMYKKPQKEVTERKIIIYPPDDPWEDIGHEKRERRHGL